MPIFVRDNNIIREANDIYIGSLGIRGTVTDAWVKSGSNDASFRKVYPRFVPAPLPIISVNDASGREGGTITFRVTLNFASEDDVTVRYATTGRTATARVDYTPISGTLTIPAGQTARTLSVRILSDTGEEGPETFTLTLSQPTNATIADGIAIGTITNVTPNNPPVITNPGNKSYEQGATIVAFAIAVSDADSGDTVTVTVTGLPTGLSYNSGTGTVSGTVSESATIQNYTVNITASDGTATVRSSFTVGVMKKPTPTVTLECFTSVGKLAINSRNFRSIGFNNTPLNLPASIFSSNTGWAYSINHSKYGILRGFRRFFGMARIASFYGISTRDGTAHISITPSSPTYRFPPGTAGITNGPTGHFRGYRFAPGVTLRLQEGSDTLILDADDFVYPTSRFAGVIITNDRQIIGAQLGAFLRFLTNKPSGHSSPDFTLSVCRPKTVST